MPIFAPPITAGAQYALVDTGQTTTSTTYTDLATVGPAVTVNVGSSGAVLLSFSTGAQNNTAGDYVAASIAISGNTTRAAGTPYEVYYQGSNEVKLTYSIVITGLAVGSTTFTLKYKVIIGGTGTFTHREISVVPL